MKWLQLLRPWSAVESHARAAAIWALQPASATRPLPGRDAAVCASRAIRDPSPPALQAIIPARIRVPHPPPFPRCGTTSTASAPGWGHPRSPSSGTASGDAATSDDATGGHARAPPGGWGALAAPGCVALPAHVEMCPTTCKAVKVIRAGAYNGSGPGLDTVVVQFTWQAALQPMGCAGTARQQWVHKSARGQCVVNRPKQGGAAGARAMAGIPARKSISGAAANAQASTNNQWWS